mgnify:CR=1 FL=1
MEWKEVRLGEISSKIGDGLHGTPKYDDEGPYYFINGNNLNCGKIIIKDDTKRVGKDEFVKNQKELNEQTILVSINGTIGNVAKYNNELCILGKSACYINVIKEVDKEFIYYVLTSANFKRNITNEATGTTIKNVSLKQMREYKFNIPCTISDQHRIASILSSLDRKIELNNKINADLEEMAQAIFKNWFVDFEPFKDGKFVDSELGMIPEGWKVSQIADIPHILETGKRPKGGAVEKGIPSVGAEHVKGMCAYDYSKTKYINCEFAAKLKTGKINGYELMIYKDGGKPGYFIPNFSIFGERYPFENCYLNEHVFKLDFDGNKEFNIFCYFFFKTEQIMSYFNAQGAKAAIPGINKKDVENIYIFSPDNESVIKFGEFAYPLFKQMLKNAIENRRLSLLRDTLLPRLMSGEIEVPQ